MGMTEREQKVRGSMGIRVMVSGAALSLAATLLVNFTKKKIAEIKEECSHGFFQQ